MRRRSYSRRAPRRHQERIRCRRVDTVGSPVRRMDVPDAVRSTSWTTTTGHDRSVPADEVDPWAWTDEDAPRDRRGRHPPLPGHRRPRLPERGGLAAGHACRSFPARAQTRRLIGVDVDSADSTRALLHRARTRACSTPSSTPPAAPVSGRPSRPPCKSRHRRPRTSPTVDRPDEGGLVRRNQLIMREALHVVRRVATGSGCCMTTPCRLRTRCSSCSPMWSPTLRSTSPAPSWCSRGGVARCRRSARSASSISGTGRRELSLEPGEIDQGQRDQPEERLGVSTCGMLVKTEVFTALGGLRPGDPGVPGRGGVRLAGAPARVPDRDHPERPDQSPAGRSGRASAGRRRGPAAGQDRPVAGHGRGRRARADLAAAAGLAAAGLELPAARDRVPARQGARPGSGRAGRARAPSSRTRAGSGRTGNGLRALQVARRAPAVIKSLRPPWWSSLRVGGGGLLRRRCPTATARWPARSRPPRSTSSPATTSPRSPRRSRRTRGSRPIVVVAALFVLRQPARRPQPVRRSGTSPARPCCRRPTRSATLWGSAWDPIAGAPGQIPPPWLALMALGSTVLAGQPEWLVTAAALRGGPARADRGLPGAPLGDRRPAGPAVGRGQLRAAPGLARRHQPGPALAQRVRAPAAAAGAGRSVRWCCAGRACPRPGAVAGAPASCWSCWPPSSRRSWWWRCWSAAIAAVRLRRTPRKVGRIGIALGLPLLVLLPVVAEPDRRAGPPVRRPGRRRRAVPAAPAVWQLLLGRETGAGLPPLWLGAVALRRDLGRRPRSGCCAGRRRPLVLAAWLDRPARLLRLRSCCPGWSSRVPPSGTEIRPWTGVYLLIAFGALVLAAAARDRRAGRRASAAQLRLACSPRRSPARCWSADHRGAARAGGSGPEPTGPIDRLRLDALPPYVRNAMLSAAGVRVLAIDLDGDRARYSVLSDDQIRLGDADRGFAFGGSAARERRRRNRGAPAGGGHRRLRHRAAAPRSRHRLRLGHRRHRGEQSRIDNTPGLGTASGNLTPPSGSCSRPAPGNRSVDGGAADRRTGRPPLAGRAGRRPALAPATVGWQQAFRLPAAGGR